MKDQRIRDPVHGLVVFSGADPFEQLIWHLVDAPEFQRLRRIKQLGFSELVFPGATHTRFSHSVGVFHTARELVGRLRKMLGSGFCERDAEVAVCAALLHDLGHGPFSHTFEGVEKARVNKSRLDTKNHESRVEAKKHETWTVEIIQGETCVGKILSNYDKEFQSQVAGLLIEDSPSDIYAAIVHSQFDADRLDYLRRDKLMTGTEHGGFDWDWLLNNLEIQNLTIGGDGDEDPFPAAALILGSKGLKAAEGYLLGRFHLYTQVYMHKATRAAEGMLAEFLKRLAEVINKGNAANTGLSEAHPLSIYFCKGGDALPNYLALDDSTIWGALPLLARSDDNLLSELATRLNNRDLYKCLDVGARAKSAAKSDAIGTFRKLLAEAQDAGEFETGDALVDRASVSPYKFHDYESPKALDKVIIRKSDGSGGYEDVEELSPVVKAMRTEKFFRVYARTPEVMTKLKGIWEEAKK